jgi:hypothetical protein
VALKTDNWRSEMHPLLNVDVTRLEEVEAAGIDSEGPFTFSSMSGARISCMAVKSPKAYLERIKARLSARGSLWSGKESGVLLYGATLDKRWLLGVALRKKHTCTARFSNGHGEKLLRQVARMMLKPPPTKDWPKASHGVVLRSPLGSWAIDGNAQKAMASTHNLRALNLKLLRPGRSPYARLGNKSLGVIRSRVQVSAYLPNFVTQIQLACPPLEVGESLVENLTPHLTGNVALVMDRFESEGSLRKPAGRYFSMKHVVLAEVRKPEAVSAVLSAMAQGPQSVQISPTRFQLGCGTGNIYVGLKGTHLYVGNDADVVDSTLAHLPNSTGMMKHSVEFEAELPLLARALSRLSFFDVVGQPEWTGLFAVGTELGPLMAKSRTLTGWVEKAAHGKHKAEFSWLLE